MTDVVASAGNVKIVITGDGANFSQVAADVNRKLEALGVKGRQAGAHMVSGVQAASGSIRILEGNVENNVRAVERFLVSSLKLGPVLQAAFPFVGAVAFGGVIAKIGQEVYKFVKAAQDAPRVISDNFASATSGMRLANDQLALVNLRLENETAKLEKKPQNHLSEALLESQIAAGKLAEALARVSKAQMDAFKGQEVGWIQANFLAKGSTSDVTNNIRNFQSQIVGRGYDYQEALDNGDKEKAAAMKDEIARLQKNYIAYLKGEQKTRSGNYTLPNGAGIVPYAAQFGDQSANLNIIQGALVSTQLSMAQQRLQEKNATDVAGNDKAKNAVATAQQALEAQRKAVQEMKESADSQLADAKHDHDVSISEEIGYWTSVLAAIKGGSAPVVAYRAEVNKKIGDLVQEQRRKLESFQDRRTSIEPNDSGVAKLIEQQKALYDAIEKATEASIKQNEQMAIARAEIARQSGTMTGAGYAQVVSDAHSAAYEQQRADLNQQLARLEGLLDQSAAREKIASAIDELDSNRQLQVMQDTRATSITYSNPFVGVADALNDLVAASHDLATTWRDIAGNAFDSVNAQIIDAASGRRTNFAGVGVGIARSVGSNALKYGEGQVASWLGFGGKGPTGKAGDAMHVLVDNQYGGSIWADNMASLPDSMASVAAAADKASSGTGGALGILGKLFGRSSSSGGSGDDDDSVTGPSDDGSGGGNFLSSLPSMIVPFLAGGGPIAGAAIVGEEGPELFVPHGSGTIVPNHKLGGMSGTHFHFGHIDARGSNDPAAVKRAVMQAVMSAAPHIVAASVSATVERARRMPTSRR